VVDEVSRRNASAVQQALTDFGLQIAALHEEVAGLRATIGGFALRMTEMEQMLHRMRVQAMGHGPTGGV
jgi:hypothetical protein